MAAAGAGIGAWMGHVAHGTNRDDAGEIGALLADGDAALIVIGIDNDASRIEQAVVRSRRHVTKRFTGDFDQAEREALAAIEQV